MPFILPFRTKNPPEGFPYCTLTIIGINFVVYFLTTKDLFVTQYWVSRLAVSHDTLSIGRLITSLFLHENPLHIIGNMLFLWLFGPAVEGRLKAAKFLLIYFTAGIAGGFLSDLIVGANQPHLYSLGASGAIMGVLGAYLYIFPYSQVMVFWIWIIRFGITQWNALWVIAFYVASDMLFGVVLHAADGVGHIAHLSGFALGYVAALVMRPHVDSHSSSQVKSMLSEYKDIRLLTPHELGILASAPGADTDTVLEYCHRSYIDVVDIDNRRDAVEMLRRNLRRLIEEGDPLKVAQIVMLLGPDDHSIPAISLLRLGSRLEQIGRHDAACLLYKRIYDMAPQSRDSETALFRLGRLLESVYCNPVAAIETYRAMLYRFPDGGMAQEARTAVARLSAVLGCAPAGVAIAPAQARAIELDESAAAQQATLPIQRRQIEL